MTVRPSAVWRRVRWVLALFVLCTLATCPAAVRQCRTEQRAEEAPALLRYLVGRVRAHVTEHGALPAGDAGPTPRVGACCVGGSTCGPETTRWDEPGWRALGFSIDGRHRFSYQLAHDGPALVLRAIGDQDCDGVVATYQVTLTLEGDTLHEVWARDQPLE